MKEKDQLGFVHRFIASDHNIPDRSMTLLLLHGTGGDENDLIPIARMIDPVGASILSPAARCLRMVCQGFFVDYPKGYLI